MSRMHGKEREIARARAERKVTETEDLGGTDEKRALIVRRANKLRVKHILSIDISTLHFTNEFL